MHVRSTIVTLGIAGMLLASCASPDSSRLRANSPAVIEQARIRVLAQLPDLDNASRDMIRTNAPRIEFVGVPFGGDYWFCWTITSNRTAVLHAFSSLDNLNNRPVTIRMPDAASKY
jgi:hypothetical protein